MDGRGAFGGTIERGRITGVEEGGYIVSSLERDGIVSPPLKAIAGEYATGDAVLFVLFSDGTGKLLCEA